MCLSSARRGNQTYLPTLLESLRKEISSTISTRRFVSPSLQIRIDPRAPVQSIRPFLDAWAACRHAPPPLSLAPSLPRPLNFPYTTQLRWWLFIMLERCSPLWTRHGQPRALWGSPPPTPSPCDSLRLHRLWGPGRTEYDNTRTEYDNTRTEHDNTRTEYDNTRTEYDNTRTWHDNTRTEYDYTRTEYDDTRTEYNNAHRAQ